MVREMAVTQLMWRLTATAEILKVRPNRFERLI